MAIKNSEGKKITAKELAEEILAAAVGTAATEYETHHLVAALTDREKGLVKDQIEKIAVRLLKKLRFVSEDEPETVS
mgnify:CR=1 FL=1